MTKYGFNKKQVVEITGLTPRQVQFYTEQGAVFSSVDPGEGRGKSRLYSENDLIDFCIIKQMARWGMTIGVIRKFIKEFREPGRSKRTGAKTFPDRYDMPMLSRDKDGKMKRSFPSITFFYSEGTEDFDSVYDPGGSRPVISRDEMRSYDSALVINLGKIITEIIPHCPNLRKRYGE